MRVRLALLVAALQVVVLAFMAGQREWIARYGAPLTLRTAPVDPNDPMRGAYVRLDYEISFVPAALCKDGPAEWTRITNYQDQRMLRDRIVYAALKVATHGIAELASLSDAPPASGPFLRGRVQSVDLNGVRVRYGIEAMFMNKESARRTEDLARRERIGAPMNVHIAAGASGISVLKDYVWEPLGITIAFDRPPPRDRSDPQQRGQPQPLTGLTVTLHNYSDHDVAIIDLPDAKSFRMVPNTGFTPGHYDWVGSDAGEPPPPKSDDIIVLAPGAKHDVHIDLTRPRWWITDTKVVGAAPMPMQDVKDGWTANFRIEYAPLGEEATLGLPHADLIRHAPLRSRAFNANQGMD